MLKGYILHRDCAIIKSGFVYFDEKRDVMPRRVMSLILASAILLTVFLSACSSQEKAKEADPYKGFHSNERLSGGGPVEAANARSVSAEAQGETARVTFAFSSGSRISDGSLEKEASGIPAYSVYMLPSPARLVVEFEGLSYWDYNRDVQLPEEWFHGSFQHMVNGLETVWVYFQLKKDDVAYQVEEHDEGLSIILKEKTHAAQTADNSEGAQELNYFAVANAYKDYCSGNISREMDMYPCLTRDGDHIILISGAFDTEQEAKDYRASTIKATENALAEQWGVSALRPGSLPAYNEQLDYAAAYALNAARIGGTEQTLPVLLPNGQYLTEVPGGEAHLYARRVGLDVDTDDESEGEDSDASASSYDELWMSDKRGSTQKRLIRYEFASIERAVYSPDGRKLAVLERSSEGSHLYIFDTDTYHLIADLTELGFGSMVSDFTWDNFGGAVYALSGSSGMQIHMYDFSVPDEGKRYSLVDDKGADEGDIGYSGGEIFFTQSDMGSSSIYRIKPEGGVRKPFATGGKFAVSADGRFMALYRTGAGVEGAFILRSMETGEEKEIPCDFPVNELLWSPKADSVYYLENRLSGGEGEDSGGEETADADPYPYTLWVYDVASGESRALADLAGTSITPSPDGSSIYIHYVDRDTMGERINATYVLNMK